MIFNCQSSINLHLGDLLETRNLIKIMIRTINQFNAQMIKIKVKNRFGLKSRKVFLASKIFRTKQMKNIKIKIKLQKLRKKKKNTSKMTHMNQRTIKIILNISKSKATPKTNRLDWLN